MEWRECLTLSQALNSGSWRVIVLPSIAYRCIISLLLYKILCTNCSALLTSYIYSLLPYHLVANIDYFLVKKRDFSINKNNVCLSGQKYKFKFKSSLYRGVTDSGNSGLHNSCTFIQSFSNSSNSPSDSWPLFSDLKWPMIDGKSLCVLCPHNLLTLVLLFWSHYRFMNIEE